MVSRLAEVVGAAATFGWTVGNLGCCTPAVAPASVIAAVACDIRLPRACRPRRSEAG